jgi:Xaa-Pro aminopeptidase
MTFLQLEQIVHLPFVQHRDIFHLSGVDQEESILVLFPDCKKPNTEKFYF